MLNASDIQVQSTDIINPLLDPEERAHMASKEYALIVDQGSNGSIEIPAVELKPRNLELNPPMKLNRD